MKVRGRLVRDERGQGAGVLIIVVLVVAVAVFFLSRTLYLGLEIDDKAEDIARTGRGIASSTDAIMQLDRTEGLGVSILNTAKPLEGQVAEINAIAKSIDGLASSILSSATSIGGSASAINSQARGILATGRSINNGVETINRTVDVTIRHVATLKGDTGPILDVARRIQQKANNICTTVGGSC